MLSCVTCTESCMYKGEGWACVNQGLRAWNFHTSPFQIRVSMQFSNSLLLTQHALICAACTVVLPGERQLVVWKYHFPYLKYSHLSTIINISSVFPWTVQHSCQRDWITLVCLSYKIFPSYHIVFIGVFELLTDRNLPWHTLSVLPAYGITMKAIIF